MTSCSGSAVVTGFAFGFSLLGAASTSSAGALSGSVVSSCSVLAVGLASRSNCFGSRSGKSFVVDCSSAVAVAALCKASSLMASFSAIFASHCASCARASSRAPCRPSTWHQTASFGERSLRLDLRLLGSPAVHTCADWLGIGKSSGPSSSRPSPCFLPIAPILGN